MGWLCQTDKTAESLKNGSLLAKEEIKSGSFPDEVLDNDISLIKPYFYSDAWEIVQEKGKCDHATLCL